MSYDATQGRIPCRGRQSDNRFPSLAARRSPNEIDLSADPAVEVVAQGVRPHLPGQIYLERGVDRHLLVVPADYERIIRISAGMKLEKRIVIDKIVKPARAQHKPQDHLTRMQRFLFVCDDTFLDEVHNAIAYHLGVDAKILLP